MYRWRIGWCRATAVVRKITSKHQGSREEFSCKLEGVTTIENVPVSGQNVSEVIEEGGKTYSALVKVLGSACPKRRNNTSGSVILKKSSCDPRNETLRHLALMQTAQSSLQLRRMGARDLRCAKVAMRRSSSAGSSRRQKRRRGGVSIPCPWECECEPELTDWKCESDSE